VGVRLGVRRCLSWAALFAAAVWLLSGSSSLAQPAMSSGARPSAQASRSETSEAPVIDADLSDLAWAKATVIENLRQRQPD
jgi:hypothetical protein